LWGECLQIGDDVRPVAGVGHPREHGHISTREHGLGIGDRGADAFPVGTGEFGTYYIAYAADPSITERMLRNMFIGDPPGNTDRILDFSTAITGSLFFVPSADMLDDLPPAATADGG